MTVHEIIRLRERIREDLDYSSTRLLSLLSTRQTGLRYALEMRWFGERMIFKEERDYDEWFKRTRRRLFL